MKKVLLFAAAASMALCAISCCSNQKSAAPAAQNEHEGDVLVIEEPVLKEVIIPEFNLANCEKDADGFYVIFNGKDFTGWRAFGGGEFPTRWVVEDGAMKFLGRGPEAEGLLRGDILFNHKFKNFEFEFEWKVDEGSNSGVFYLAKEYFIGNSKKVTSSAQTGLEYQILDNVNHDDSFKGKDGNRRSASLYDMIPANPQNSKPWGEWNTGKIVVNNGEVTHYQNGEKVVSYTLWTPEWEQMLRGCKWAPERDPIAFACFKNCGGQSHSGYFAFQDHGDVVWYKNIRVKEL